MPAIKAVHTESRPSSALSSGYTTADLISASCSGVCVKFCRYLEMQSVCVAVCLGVRAL